jgi:L-ascorbate metabolism protein UlaG (beta-lactamase superfamily)
MTPALSDHFNGKTFFQSHHRKAARRFALLRWRLTAKPKPWPREVPITARVEGPPPGPGQVFVTWLGHAGFLLRTSGAAALIDPVFSERASPFRWIGPRRVHAPPIDVDALPPISAVLISHDHYDHLDETSIRQLAHRFAPTFVAPLRHRPLLQQYGVRDVVELDWWQSCDLPGIGVVTLTPTQHWSNRLGTPRNHRLWGGFYLRFRPSAEDGTAASLWFVGDTGHAPKIVEAVRACCGSPDLALVPIGAYEPRWFMAPMHLNPAEAVQLHLDSGARRSIGMHWGTFRLSDEGREEPPSALADAVRHAALDSTDFGVIAPGETVVLETRASLKS